MTHLAARGWLCVSVVERFLSYLYCRHMEREPRAAHIGDTATPT